MAGESAWIGIHGQCFELLFDQESTAYVLDPPILEGEEGYYWSGSGSWIYVAKPEFGRVWLSKDEDGNGYTFSEPLNGLYQIYENPGRWPFHYDVDAKTVQVIDGHVDYTAAPESFRSRGVVYVAVNNLDSFRVHIIVERPSSGIFVYLV